MTTTVGRRTNRWRLTEVTATDDAVIAELADITRDSFAVGDMVPGLPAADGASDTEASIRDELAAGIRMWMADAGDGRPVGSVRAIPRPDGVWQIRRLAVSLAAQGRGLGRALVRGLERAARVEGMRTVVVWALVERGVAPFYSMLGYRTTGHFGSPDKPLSEAIMELSLDEPGEPLEYPWGTEPTLTGGSLHTWFGSATDTVVIVGTPGEDTLATVADQHAMATALAGHDVRFLGVDSAPDPTSDTRFDILASQADVVRGTGLLFHRPCTTVVEFTMPRTVAPDLLALWRLPIAHGLSD
ncbi:MAG TPA: GNAT family N-acetyltransferase [Pseudonocardiaceae bacterium]|nr:GNAT family N-acetyltransferase [Pseudonocardiaceae bacterium]